MSLCGEMPEKTGFAKVNYKVSNASVFAMAMVVAIHTAGRPLEAIEKGTVLWWRESLLFFGSVAITLAMRKCCPMAARIVFGER